MKKEYEQVQDALQAVRMKGYGVISPVKGEITLEEPVVIRQGNKYGVKIRSEAPSIHLIRANIETEIAPIVGSEQQANDLIAYIRENQQTEDGIWNTNIFGKSVEQLVEETASAENSPASATSARKSCRIRCRRWSTISAAAWCASSFKKEKIYGKRMSGLSGRAFFLRFTEKHV